MVICLSRAMLASPTICTTTAQIEAALPVEQRSAFRRFRQVMNSPSDAPGCSLVLGHVFRCVDAYRMSLGDSATESLEETVATIKSLAGAIHTVPLLPFSRAAMWRRLSRSQAWGLCIDLRPDQLPSVVQEGIGAALCWAWLTDIRFSASMATNIRRALEAGEDMTLSTSIPAKQLASARRTANTIFNRSAAAPADASNPERFAAEVRHWFRNRTFYGSDKSQQAVFHHRTQSAAQFHASAQWLRQRAERGDNLAAMACIGALFAMRPDLMARIPILNSATNDDWVVAVDIDTGCLHFAVSIFAEGGAAPPINADRGAIASASSIFVTPLPAFLSKLLPKKRSDSQIANTVGELLPTSTPLDSHTKTLDQAARIAPSFARFRNTLGPFAVSMGIDRYVASVITHDPRLVPSGKYFYARATRQELWAASDALFEAMGWGPAAPYAEGLAAGSQVTPTTDTIRTWFQWLEGEVEAVRPSVNPTKEQVICFHNVFAMAVASLLSFVLALRERKAIPITARTAMARGLTLPVGDKRCGMVPGPRSISLPEIANALVARYFDHVAATDTCLASLGIPPDGAPRRRLRQILAGESVPLLATISKGRHKAIGTSTLEKWWPTRFGLAGNNGRHYVQNGLRNRNVRSTDLDAHVRHCLRGMSVASSASTKSISTLADAVVPALNALIFDAGLRALIGLHSVKEVCK